MKKHFAIPLFLILLYSCNPSKVAQAEINHDREVYANLVLFENLEYRIDYEFKFDSEAEFEIGRFEINSDTITLYPNQSLTTENFDPLTYGYLWHLKQMELDGKSYTTKRVLN